MRKIAIGLLLAALLSVMLVGVAAAQGWPPYYYAGWRDCYPPGCIPPYHYGMYGGYWPGYGSGNYTYNYNYSYSYPTTYYPYYPYYYWGGYWYPAP
jgi:hypothetical protein